MSCTRSDYCPQGPFPLEIMFAILDMADITVAECVRLTCKYMFCNMKTIKEAGELAYEAAYRGYFEVYNLFMSYDHIVSGRCDVLAWTMYHSIDVALAEPSPANFSLCSASQMDKWEALLDDGLAYVAAAIGNVEIIRKNLKNWSQCTKTQMMKILFYNHHFDAFDSLITDPDCIHNQANYATVLDREDFAEMLRQNSVEGIARLMDHGIMLSIPRIICGHFGYISIEVIDVLNAKHPRMFDRNMIYYAIIPHERTDVLDRIRNGVYTVPEYFDTVDYLYAQALSQGSTVILKWLEDNEYVRDGVLVRYDYVNP